MTDVAAFGETPAPEVTTENVDALIEQQKGAEPAPTEEKTEKHEKSEEVPKVPIHALHEERLRRKALEAEKRALAEEVANFKREREENTRMLQERFAAMQKQQINPQEQPLEYLTELHKQQQEAIQRIESQTQEQERRRSEEMAINRFHHFVKSDEESFAAQNPDYLKAVGFAKEHKFKEYTALGYSEEEAIAAVQQDAVGIAQRALQIRESPAKLAYEYAKSIGYKPSVDAEKKLGMMEAGQKASKPSSGGGNDTGKLTIEHLASLSNEDFHKLNLTDEQFRKVMGG